MKSLPSKLGDPEEEEEDARKEIENSWRKSPPELANRDVYAFTETL